MSLNEMIKVTEAFEKPDYLDVDGLTNLFCGETLELRMSRILTWPFKYPLYQTS